ncbi:uncharacterized protein KGF55_003211 [Candida pseudojiufengensis]|uniref:uncharacterized protein n=1 Tax=Candida pseudojiufengensis TaxID=497109 RepID=UPI0022252286|nr:uncharacterized protein KGF55_003211 [Candida pseudojiufengensis]KAI5962135.1 hypothetical protein KGF55_003211 [Candida pseudojiufengensis]
MNLFQTLVISICLVAFLVLLLKSWRKSPLGAGLAVLKTVEKGAEIVTFVACGKNLLVSSQGLLTPSCLAASTIWLGLSAIRGGVEKAGDNLFGTKISQKT